MRCLCKYSLNPVPDYKGETQLNKLKRALLSVALVAIIGMTWFCVSNIAHKREPIKNADTSTLLQRLNDPSVTPEEVISIYFWAMNAHNKEVAADCLSTRRKSLIMRAEVTDPYKEIDYIKIIAIGQRKPTINPYGYRTDWQKKWADITAIWVDYEVKYHRIVSQESGKHGWNYILVREKQDSPWRIEDWGY